MSAAAPLLDVERLVVDFPLGRGVVRHAVAEVSLTIGHGETVGLVGESGSGKSTLGRTIVGLTRPTAGTVRFDGRDITALRGRRRRRLSHDIQYVFQDPFASLNETRTIGDILQEPLLAAGRGGRGDRVKRVAEMLDLVGLPRTASERYPGSFSGGQRQRIAIARALAVSPKLVICDEPTSALDLSVQAQILNLLRDLQREFGISYLFIAHNLDVVRVMADRTVVMRNGRIVEQGPADVIARAPSDPYTQALVAATPHADPELQRRARAHRTAGRAGSPVPPSDLANSR